MQKAFINVSSVLDKADFKKLGWQQFKGSVDEFRRLFKLFEEERETSFMARRDKEGLPVKFLVVIFLEPIGMFQFSGKVFWEAGVPLRNLTGPDPEKLLLFNNLWVFCFKEAFTIGRAF